jgi:hypothetical protein
VSVWVALVAEPEKVDDFVDDDERRVNILGRVARRNTETCTGHDEGRRRKAYDDYRKLRMDRCGR